MVIVTFKSSREQNLNEIKSPFMFRMNSASIKLVINQLILPIVNEQSVANVTSSGGDTYLGRVIVAIVDGRPKC